MTLALFFGILISCTHFYRYQETRIPPRCFDTPVQTSGTIGTFPKRYEGVGDSSYLSFDLNILQSWPRECGSGRKVRAYANYEDEAPVLKIGDSVKVQVHIRPLGSLWNRGSLPSNVHALANKTSALANIIEVTAIEQRSSALSALRYRLSQSIRRHVKQASAERLLQGLLLGRQEALNPEDWLFLREFGIVHVLVVSGVHVSLVVLWMQYLLTLPRRLFLLRDDTGRGWLNLMAVSSLACGYVLIAGASLPAQRALFMMCIAQFMRVLLWRVSPLSLIVASASVLITINPWSALTSGFWLSILLTGIIIVEAEYAPQNRFLRWLRLTFLLTAASSLLSIFFFNQFSIAALLSNLVIAPVFTIGVLPAGLLGLAFSEISPEVGGWLLSGTATLVSRLITLITTTDRLRALGQLESAHIHPGIFLIVAVAQLVSTLPRKAATLLMLLMPLSVSGSSHLPHLAEAVIVDVGQGTMVLVSNGDFTFVYDTGGVGGSGTSIAERAVIPWLKSRGVNEINLLVVSHGDLDHSGGLRAVREHFDIERHWGFGGEPCVPGRVLSPSQGFTVGAVMGTGKQLASTNADSCVVLIEYLGQSILLAGDIPKSTELELIASRILPKKIHILVAAHHGSVTSSSQTFIDKLDPTHTVFTTKRANRFSHPHSSVLRRFLNANTKVWDTAKDGAVTFNLTPSRGLSANRMRGGYSPYWAQF